MLNLSSWKGSDIKVEGRNNPQAFRLEEKQLASYLCYASQSKKMLSQKITCKLRVTHKPTRISLFPCLNCYIQEWYPSLIRWDKPLHVITQLCIGTSSRYVLCFSHVLWFPLKTSMHKAGKEIKDVMQVPGLPGALQSASAPQFTCTQYLYSIFYGKLKLLWNTHQMCEISVNWGHLKFTCALGKITAAESTDSKRKGVYYGQERNNLTTFRIRSSPTVKKLDNV